MRYSGILLRFILGSFLFHLPHVTSRSLFARNSHGTFNHYSSASASIEFNNRPARRMQQAVVAPVSGSAASPNSQQGHTRLHAVGLSYTRDDGASSSTDPPRTGQQAPPAQDIEMGILQPSAAAQTTLAPSSTATAQAGYPWTQQPPPAEQMVPEIFWDPRRKACVTTYTGALGCVSGIACVIGGLGSGQTAVAVGGGVCIVLGALLAREGSAEWSRYDDLE